MKKLNQMKTISLVLMFSFFFIISCNKNNEVVTKPEATLSISKITPTQGAVGTIVKIMGKNFGKDKTIIKFYFNAKEAELVKVLDTELEVKVPIGATTVKVSIEMNKNKVNGPKFTVIKAVK